MKTATPTIIKNRASHLKVIKNTIQTNKQTAKKIEINTFTPNFNYVNHLGELVYPKTHLTV